MGAGGLLAGGAIGLDADASLRAPFIVSHALTSSLVSLGLSAFGWPGVMMEFQMVREGVLLKDAEFRAKAKV